MILTNLWLSNFRNHTNTHIVLKTGVTGIIGDNGSGKSSIIEAIQFLLTGELFTGTKEQAIQLETTSGYVAGSFILDKKVGRLERHLDSSKVVLTYDGKEYKKSGEVKDLWDKLLQLNSEIIKKVIIARQGHIAQLFSGDPAIREKVFQRIFLVPPTEKIRAILWKDYLKQAPPVVPEEDRLELGITKDRLTDEIEVLKQTIAQTPILKEDVKDSIKAKINHIQQCISDEGKRHVLGGVLNSVIEERKVLIVAQSKVKQKLKIDIEKYKRMHTILLQQRGLYLQKIQCEEKLANLHLPHSAEHQLAILTEIEILKADKKKHEEEWAINKAEFNKLAAEETALNKFNGLAKCPTCKQDIHDIQTHLKDIFSKKKQLQIDGVVFQMSITELNTTLNGLMEEQESYQSVESQRERWSAQISQLGNLTFDEETLTNTAAVISRYEELTAEDNELTMKITKLSARHDTIDAEIMALATYKGHDREAELEKITQQLVTDVENTRKHQQLSVDLRVKQAEVTTLTTRIRTSEEIGKKNQQRNKYVEALTKVYDTLHTSQFPRKLIMSYADIVSAYLQENLALFDIPYSARVADNFLIEMIDDQDRVLPVVSGGQEIVVGISLHLALHDLFSQSFPLMIIDEGTTHLDKANRIAYFNVIKGLKDKSKLKQIFIIDHDPQLSEVVDNVINLNK